LLINEDECKENKNSYNFSENDDSSELWVQTGSISMFTCL